MAGLLAQLRKRAIREQTAPDSATIPHRTAAAWHSPCFFVSKQINRAGGKTKVRRPFLASSFIALFFMWACAQTIELRVSPDVPAAKAEAKVTQDDNNNTVVEVKAEYLAPPENL